MPPGLVTPLPNWPMVLSPQHHAIPLDEEEEQWYLYPPATPVTPVGPDTCTGVLESVVPTPFKAIEVDQAAPRHQTVPSILTTHVVSSPVVRSR